VAVRTSDEDTSVNQTKSAVHTVETRIVAEKLAAMATLNVLITVGRCWCMA
jgi:hypothetical protein